MTIISPLPYTLSNGTTNDATQVMADFNQIVNDTNANAAHNGANSDITSLTGLTTPLSAAQGGTGNANGTANIAGGTAGAIPYQSAANTTALLAAGTAGQILTSGGAGAPVWTANASYYRNYAHNGCGQVAQRPSIANSGANIQIYGACDRWLIGTSGASTQTNGVLAQGSMTCLDGVTRTAVQANSITATGASTTLVMKQRLESRDTVDLNGQTITVQCEVLQATGAAIGYNIVVNAAGATDNFSTVTNIATSASQSVPSGIVTQISFTTVLNTSQASNGLEFVISAACGAVTGQTFTMSVFKIATTNSVTPYNNAGRTYQEELALCQRYLPCVADSRPSGATSPAIGYVNSTAAYATVVFSLYPNQARVPITTLLSIVTGSASLTDTAGASHTVTATTFLTSGANSIAAQFTASGLTASQPVLFEVSGGFFLLGGGAEL